MASTAMNSRREQNRLKSAVGQSYNKLYAQFMAPELMTVGNYTIIEQIGEGSFGKVYLAWHSLTHRKVVLKTGDKHDPNVVREVFYHRQFDYSFITKLYEVIVTETKVWMVLEYCQGGELYEKLLKLRRFPLFECIELFVQIVGAVYYAHSLQCVHRDLKLENILLDAKGNAKLTDFGFTREFMTKTTLDTVCGTTVYMAPEMIQRQSYDGYKVDTWSLGVILYSMITGELPFDENDETQTQYQIVNQEPDWKEGLIHGEVKDLLTHLLDKNSETRYSAEQILKHSFLQPYGAVVLENANQIIYTQRQGKTHFRTRTERRLMKRLKRSGVHVSSLKQSVLKRKCDSLSGLWFLLLEQELKLEKNNGPKRSKSLLSVRKVLENTMNSESMEEGIIKSSLEITKVSSLGRAINKTASVVSPITLTFNEDSRVPVASLNSRFILPQSSRYSRSLRKEKSANSQGNNESVQVNVDEKLKSDKQSDLREQESRISSSGDKPEGNKKTKFLKKVHEFFKSKKVTLGNATAVKNHGQGVKGIKSNVAAIRDSFASNRPHSQDSQNRNDGSAHSTTIDKNSERVRESSHTSIESMDTKYANGIAGVTPNPNDVQQVDLTTNKVIIEEPELKRSKYSNFEKLSRQISDGLDVNDFITKQSSSNDGQRTSPGFKSRPLSGSSQISNETYTSDYSTDGNASWHKSSEMLTSSSQLGTSSYSVSYTDKHNSLNASRRQLARNASLVSTNSSASELSSRADSFYDIATATSPNPLDGRTRNSAAVKQSILPRIGEQRAWIKKRSSSLGNSRNVNTMKRGPKSGFMMSNKSNSIIREENSSDDEEGDYLGGISTSSQVLSGKHMTDDYKVASEDNIANTSESTAPPRISRRVHSDGSGYAIKPYDRSDKESLDSELEKPDNEGYGVTEN